MYQKFQVNLYLKLKKWVVDEKYTYVTNALKRIELKDYKKAMMKVIPLENEDFKHLIFDELRKEGLVKYERTIRK